MKWLIDWADPSTFGITTFTSFFSVTLTDAGWVESMEAGLKSYLKAWKAGDSLEARLDAKLDPILSSWTAPLKGSPNGSILSNDHSLI